MTEPTPQFLVGTSGWTYERWNRTFKDQTYHRWRERAPAGFQYVLKAPRLVAHRRYLQGVETDLGQFWRSRRGWLAT
jgi:uncharacterized protein YecE (DUF72 family)